MPGPGGPGQETAATQAVQLTYPPYDGLKKRLAVIRFENKVRTPIPDESWKIGEGLTEMLTTELFKTGRFIMVERAALTDIVKEQELGQTGLVRKETAARVGELLGAQLLITGAVTEFEARSGGGGGGVGYAGFALKLRTESAHVGVDVRLVDSSTGQILKSFNADAKAQSTGIGFAANIQGVAFGSDAFDKTPLGQAAREAMYKAVMFIIKEMEVVPWTGRVVQVKQREVYVNAGTNVNLKPGTKLAAYVKGEDLIDPATGLNLGSKDTLIGTVTLMQVQDKFSIGTFAGNGALKRGDLVKFQ
jgi:curli biogenesis system outer membrane secretion channel CsgG